MKLLLSLWVSWLINFFIVLITDWLFKSCLVDKCYLLVTKTVWCGSWLVIMQHFLDCLIFCSVFSLKIWCIWALFQCIWFLEVKLPQKESQFGFHAQICVCLHPQESIFCLIQYFNSCPLVCPTEMQLFIFW